LRRFVNIAADFAGCGVLLLHRRGDPGRDLADPGYRLRNRPDGTDRAGRLRLHGGDLSGDLFRRLGRLCRQILHLARHHGEALACLAGTRGLDGGIQGQQIGLLRNVIDQPDDFANLLGRMIEADNGLTGMFRLLGGFRADPGGFTDLLADLPDRGGKLLRCGGDHLHV